MKTHNHHFTIVPVAHDPSVRRDDRAALRFAGIDGDYATEVGALIELQMSGVDESRYYVAKSYAVTGVL